ncbi:MULTISPECIES: carboxymuconolactone decarboxylase [Streptomyces]|uniref:carboxymuconolactone decarboxylase n=1 Tax=Streptomyces TaxID=1883 RepID=UPI00201CBB57|nr:carboxymuconolactone decarboxylase [Streptomyces panaciradicis]MCL6667576.1 carboxymuconolactone decarboxylase [Streptomyces panaciradicis]
MTAAPDTPVLDTLTAMTLDSVERCHMEPRSLILARISALVAMDAPAISYLAHIDPAIKADFTVDQLQDLLVAIAPVVGTARVMSAAGHIAQAFGVAIALAETEAEAMAQAEAESRKA